MYGEGPTKYERYTIEVEAVDIVEAVMMINKQAAEKYKEEFPNGQILYVDIDMKQKIVSKSEE